MISNEFILKRHKQGIVLDSPEKNLSEKSVCSVGHLMQLPVNFYFMDHESRFKKVNAITAVSGGYGSEQDAVGKSLLDVSHKDMALQIQRADMHIIQMQRSNISTEAYLRKDNLPLTAVSIKFPWFDNDRVAGIFGCSILLGYEGAPSLSDALSLLIPTGLLAPNIKVDQFIDRWVWECEGQIFDSRDKEILYWLIRGKTAKQIGLILGLSYRTVEHRLENIKIKLNVPSRSALIDRVFDHFISPPVLSGNQIRSAKD